MGCAGNDGPLAGYWEFPGGKVGQGETYEQATVREALEETGLQVQIVGEFPAKEFDYDYGRFWRFVSFTAAQPATPNQNPCPRDTVGSSAANFVSIVFHRPMLN